MRKNPERIEELILQFDLARIFFAEEEEEEEAPSIVTSLKDITDLKRTEMIQHVLYQIASAVHTTKNISELSEVIQQKLGAILDTKNFFIALYNKKDNTLSLPYYKDEKDHFETFPAGKTCTAYVIRNDRPILATRKKINELVKAGEVEIIGTLAKVWLGVPLKLGKEVTGAVVVQSYTDENAYSEKDLEILEFVANQIGLFIEHKRAEEELRKSEGKYRALIETTDTGYLIIGETGEVIDANPEYVRLAGHQRLEEILDRSVMEWTAAHDLERNAQEVKKCVEQGFIRNLEIDYVDKDGKITPIEINAKVVEIEEGIRIISLCRDITERKQAEEQLQERLQELEIYYKATIGREGRIIELKQQVNELLVQLGKEKKYDV